MIKQNAMLVMRVLVSAMKWAIKGHVFIIIMRISMS